MPGVGLGGGSAGQEPLAHAVGAGRAGQQARQRADLVLFQPRRLGEPAFRLARRIASITSCQIGAAPVTPLESIMRLLSLLPAQTPTT